MTPTRKAELIDNVEVAVWLSKQSSRGGYRLGAANSRAGVLAAVCWVRARVLCWHAGGGRQRKRLELADGRLIKVPPLRLLQVGDLNLKAPDPRVDAQPVVED